MSSSQYIWPVTTLEGEPSRKDIANMPVHCRKIRRRERRKGGRLRVRRAFTKKKSKSVTVTCL
jgi:hypothetical protein